MYIAIAALLITGTVLTIREYVLIKKPYTPPPTPRPEQPRTPAPSPSPGATPAPSPSPTPYIKPIPVKIYFTEREIETDIVKVGILENGEMGTVDDAKLAAWLEEGPAPGESGNALINGHVRWKGTKGYFSILKEMKIGEEVVIEFEDGSAKAFEAVSIDIYKLDDIPDEVLNLGGETRMTLITCLGDYNPDIGTSESRVVVVCKPK
ncbi:MAG: Sortase family protein [Firmicutes bacterium ADurb.Bin182]|nr:MAG: Sortase family protein [Firmicutes bacterium ADurb.Bin182]